MRGLVRLCCCITDTLSWDDRGVGEGDLLYARHPMPSLVLMRQVHAELGKMAARVRHQDGYVRALASKLFKPIYRNRQQWRLI